MGELLPSRREPANLRRALQPLLRVGRTMPLQQACVFLLVCEQEGLTVTSYAAAAQITQPTMSRYLRALGPEGSGLVEPRRDAREMRLRLYTLTDAGRALRDEISNLILLIRVENPP
jgi:DNA-binding MarR family transcriptional regulator